MCTVVAVTMLAVRFARNVGRETDIGADSDDCCDAVRLGD